MGCHGQGLHRRERRRGGVVPRPRASRRPRGDARADRPAGLRAHQLLHDRSRQRRWPTTWSRTRRPGSATCTWSAADRKRSRRRSRWRGSTSSRRASRERTHFIARRQSYHGNTLGALAVGGNEWRREQFAPLLIDVAPRLAVLRVSRAAARTSRPAVRRAPRGGAGRHDPALGPERVIAFVAETVGGATRARCRRCPATSSACARSATATASS